MKTIVWLGIIATALGGQAIAGREPGHGKTKNQVTIEGEVVDLTCYLGHKSSGEKHVKCAEMCVEKGLPVGIVDAKTGKVYLVSGSNHEPANAELIKFCGQKVKITGEAFEGKGVNLIIMSKVGK